MLPRVAAASRRASIAYIPITGLRKAVRPHEFPRRHIALLPWRRSQRLQDPPVYFPRTASYALEKRWRGALGRAVTTALVLYTCWQIFATIVLDPLFDWLDAEWEAMTDEAKQELSNPPVNNSNLWSFFLPFPFTAKSVEQPRYKTHDPEWRMFLAVNNDRQRQKDIKFAFAELVRQLIEKHPGCESMRHEGSSIRIVRYWLDIMYPGRPPPKHYVSGIAFDPDGIHWVTQPMDSWAARHLSKVLYPKPVALTVWTFFNTLFRQSTQDLAQALGLRSTLTPSTDTALRPSDKEKAKAGTPGQQPANASGQSGQPTRLPMPTAGSGAIIAISNDKSQVMSRVQVAIAQASRTLFKYWRPTVQPPYKGCLEINGLVELEGNSIALGLYVFGWYDPKLKKFVGVEALHKHRVRVTPASKR